MRLFRHAWKAMGSPCELQLFAPSAEVARAATERVVADVARLEQRYSRFRDDSLLSEINRVAERGGELQVDEETAALLDYAAACHQQSDGLFDVTSGVLRSAWRFESGEPPANDGLEPLLARIGWHRLRWERPRLVFPEPGLELDLGGIVKEYAVDRAATLLCESGLPHAMVNLGGDIRVAGPRGDGTPWQIGIRHPRRPGALLRSIPLSEGAIATSGDYERCMEIDGTRYGHILNPRTGWPVRQMASVTVVAPLCVVAGSAATIGMLREAQGPTWLAELGLDHLWVDVDGTHGGSLCGPTQNSLDSRSGSRIHSIP